MTRKVPKLTGALRAANAKSATKCKVSSPGAAQERRAKFMVSLVSEANEVHAQDNCQQLDFGIAPQARCNVKKILHQVLGKLHSLSLRNALSPRRVKSNFS